MTKWSLEQAIEAERLRVSECENRVTAQEGVVLELVVKGAGEPLERAKDFLETLYDSLNAARRQLYYLERRLENEGSETQQGA